MPGPDLLRPRRDRQERPSGARALVGRFLPAALVAAGLWAGCGKKGPPLPPLPRVPAAAADVEATLWGSILELSWSAAPPPEPGQVRVGYEIAWLVEPRSGGEPASAAGAPAGAAATGRIMAEGRRAPGPALEWSGSGSRRARRAEARVEIGEIPSRSALSVIVVARAGRQSAPSKPVTIDASGDAPPAVEEFEARSEPQGVRLRWRAAGAPARLELFRLEPGPGSRPLLLARVDPASGQFLDASARLGAQYRYSARPRRAAGERAWVAGPQVDSAPLAYTDTFAPEAPRGLTLLVESGGARLLWSPNREPDLAGYRVYRRLGDTEEEAVGSVSRSEVSWLDTEAAEGAQVVYRVTAFDTSPQQNESAFSEPVAATVRRPRTLPPPPRTLLPSAPAAKPGEAPAPRDEKDPSPGEPPEGEQP